MFKSNQITSLIGENGVGKSSILHALTGVLSPASGNITLNGQPLGPFHQRAQLISMVSQKDNAPADLTVHQRISQGLFPVLGQLKRDKRELVQESAERFQVQDYLERSMGSLSGGEAKRVHLAAGTVNPNSKVHIFDEPFTGLDIRHEESLIECLKVLRNQNKVVLLVTHRLSLAKALSDSVLLLKNQQKITQKKPQEALSTDRLLEAFGCVPNCF